MMRSRSGFLSDMIKGSLFFILVIFVVPGLTIHAQSAEPTPIPPVLTSVAGRVPASIMLSREVAPSGVLKPGDDVNIKLRVNGQKQAGCYGVPLQPVDVVVFADISPSAYNPNRIRGQQILRSLWMQIDQPIYQTSDGKPAISRIAFVTVDSGDTAPDEPRVRLPFTNTLTAINAAIDGWQAPGADTGFQKGIDLASKLLAEQGRPDAKRVLVLLLHDTYFFDDKGVVLEAGKKAAGQAQVYVIGNLLGIEKAVQLTQDVAKQVTGSTDRVLLNPSAEDLRRLFVSASGGSATSWGRVLGLAEEITPSELVAIWASDIQDGGKLDKNRITWGAQALTAFDPGKPVQVNYHLRIVEHASTATLNLSATADLVDCNGFLQIGTDQGPLKGQIKSEPVFATQTPAATRSTETATTTPTPRGPAPQPTQSVGHPDGDLSPSFDFRWLVIPLLLLLFTLLLWWLLSRQHKRVSPSLAPPKPMTPKPPLVELPTPKPPSGETILAGVAADDSVLRAQLHTATTFAGRVPTGQTGFGRSPVAVRAFGTVAEMRSRTAAAKGEAGFNLEALGPMFVWQTEENGQRSEREVPTTLLQRVIEERITPETPLSAAWTLTPADNAVIEMRARDNASTKQIDIQARSTYVVPKQGQIAPEKAYWLLLRFLSNPERKALAPQPAIETERNA